MIYGQLHTWAVRVANKIRRITGSLARDAPFLKSTNLFFCWRRSHISQHCPLALSQGQVTNQGPECPPSLAGVPGGRGPHAVLWVSDAAALCGALPRAFDLSPGARVSLLVLNYLLYLLSLLPGLGVTTPIHHGTCARGLLLRTKIDFTAFWGSNTGGGRQAGNRDPGIGGQHPVPVPGPARPASVGFQRPSPRRQGAGVCVPLPEAKISLEFISSPHGSQVAIICCEGTGSPPGVLIATQRFRRSEGPGFSSPHLRAFNPNYLLSARPGLPRPSPPLANYRATWGCQDESLSWVEAT